MAYYTHEERIRFAREVLAEKRLTQNAYRRHRGYGKEMVCAMSSFGPDIDNWSHCPASFMPDWLAARIPGWFDCLPEDQIYAHQERLVDLAERWTVLTAFDWRDLHRDFIASCWTYNGFMSRIEKQIRMAEDREAAPYLREIREQRGPAITHDVPIDIPMVSYKEKELVA